MTSAREGVRVSGSGGWLARFRQGAPALLATLLLWFAVELLAVLLLPVIVPRHVALSWYLGAESRAATRRLLEDRDSFLLYDPITGWRNRPGCGQGTWRIDGLGSRSTHAIAWERHRPRRLLFLGNSLTNGGMNVTATETISAACEDSLTEAGNFATMLYSLDQVLLAYRSGLDRFDADAVVVGLPENVDEGLTNRYLPFFKPRFVEEQGRLRLVPVPSREEWSAMLRSSAVLDTLGRDDAWLSRFESYRRFGLTPVTAGLAWAFEKARHFPALLTGESEAPHLARRLMHELAGEGARHHARTVFVLLPTRYVTFSSGWRRFLPDHHARFVAELRGEGLVVLDGRALLRASGLPSWQLYSPDDLHFQPAGNRVLAAGLRELLKLDHLPAGAPTAPAALAR
jgi:hypothetical protein